MVERVLGGRYRVVRHLARGGMAEVYLARDELLDRHVAVKVLFPELAEDGSFVERFRREARAAAGLNHPSIVSVFDFGEDEGSYYIVMEFVDGTTLRDVIRSEGPLEPTQAAQVGADIAAALSVAHQHGIIHRDVKPGNVLIADATSSVKVADFGIARAGDPRESLTMTGAVMGTATYLAPEQAQGRPIDHRTDLYALGIVLYEMLAGRAPFSGETPMAIAYKHLSESPAAPSTHNPAVPAALDRVVLRAMEKDPDARYASANELRADLLTAARGAEAEPTVVAAPAVAVGATQVLPPVTEVATAVPADAPPMAARHPDDAYRRRRLAIGLALLVLLAIVVVILLTRDGGGAATVPSVVGLTVDDARARLEEVDLRSAVEEADRLGVPNQVLEQRPAANEEVDRTTTVTLVVPASTSTVPSTVPRTTRTTRPAPPTTNAPPETTAPPPPTTSPPVTAPPRTNPPQSTLPRVTIPRSPTTGG